MPPVYPKKAAHARFTYHTVFYYPYAGGFCPEIATKYGLEAAVSLYCFIDHLHYGSQLDMNSPESGTRYIDGMWWQCESLEKIHRPIKEIVSFPKFQRSIKRFIKDKIVLNSKTNGHERYALNGDVYIAFRKSDGKAV